MQRLFSMFPNGWPGKGLLILRLVAGIFLIEDGIRAFIGSPRLEPMTLLLFAAAAGGIFLLVGLWTPVAGIVVGVAEIVILQSCPVNLRSAILLSAFGITLAMLGPGAWSVDALLFGRHRLDLH